MANDAAAMSIAEVFVPRLSERSRSVMVAFSLVFTMKMPAIDRKMPMAAMAIGAITARNCIPGFIAKAVAPSAAVLSMLPQ